jgi:hypothetical protein
MANRFAQSFDTLFVSSHSGQKPLFRPATVAIHDDGNVARQIGGWR